MIIFERGGRQVSREELRKPTNQDLTPLLQTLVDKQRQFNTPPLASRNSGDGFTRVEQSPIFLAFHRQAINPYTVPWFTRYEQLQIQNRFRGAAFEALGTVILQQQTADHPEITILDHERTLKLYERMYPYSWRIPHLFGSDGLAGLYAPDALEITLSSTGEPKITRGFDMKTGSSWMEWQAYYALIKRHQDTRQDFSDIFAAQSPLEVVCLNGSNRVNNISFGKSGKIVEVKISMGQFSGWVDTVYSKFRINEDSATLKEIQERAIYQWEKANAVNPRKLTPEYMAHLRKILDPDIPDITVN